MDQIETGVVGAIDRGNVDEAASLAIRKYGPQIFGYLAAMLGDEDEAADAFAEFSERVWRALPGFRRAASLRTWAYRVAWSCAQDALRDPFRRRAHTLSTAARSRLAAPHSSCPAWRRSSAQQQLIALRRHLRPCEQTLLVLRLDRGLSWREVAAVLADGDAPPPSEAALRKRFEALKDKLRGLMRGVAQEAA